MGFLCRISATQVAREQGKSRLGVSGTGSLAALELGNSLVLSEQEEVLDLRRSNLSGGLVTQNVDSR